MHAATRFIAAFALTAIVASPAAAYIHFPPTTMPNMCKQSTAVRVLQVKKHDKEKGVIVYELVETLKGDKPKEDTFKHVIPKDASGTKAIFDWVADGKRAVVFTIEGGAIRCGYVFIDNFCYSIDHNKRDNFWLLIRVDPEMAACYHGTAERLQGIAKDLLAGKDVKVPVDESVKPLTTKEREKLAPAINDVLNKNRK